MDKLTLLIGGVVAAGLAAVWFNMNQPTTGHSMAPPDTSGIPEGAPIAVVNVPAEFSPLAKTGKLAFNAKCAQCHGQNAAGRNGMAPPLVHQFYRPGHHGDGAFLRAVQNGVQAHHWTFGNMPPVEGLTGGDVKAVVAYVRELQRENGIN